MTIFSFFNKKSKKESSESGISFITPPPSCPPSTGKHLPTITSTAEAYRRSKIIAIFELVATMLMIVLDIISTTYSSRPICYDQQWNVYNWRWDDFSLFPTIGSNIWVPIFGIISAIWGITAICNSRFAGNKVLVPRFIMCTIMPVAFGALIFCCFSRIGGLVIHGEYNVCADEAAQTAQAIVAFEIVIAILAFLTLVANITAAVYICRYWYGNELELAPNVSVCISNAMSDLEKAIGSSIKPKSQPMYQVTYAPTTDDLTIVKSPTGASATTANDCNIIGESLFLPSDAKSNQEESINKIDRECEGQKQQVNATAVGVLHI